MGDDRIKLSVVVNTTQITIVLECDNRVRLKCRRGKRVVGLGKGRCIKRCVVALEELHQNIDECRLTGSRLTVEHDELVKGTRYTRDNGTDRPFDLTALVFVIQRGNKTIPIIMRSFRERIGQTASRVGLLPHLSVREGEFPVQGTSGVRHGGNPVAIGGPALRGIIPQELEPRTALIGTLKSLREITKLTVDELDYTKLIRVP